MEKSFKRLSDNKFLISLEHNIWSEKKSDAKRFSINEYKLIYNTLLNSYQEKDIVIYTDYNFKK